MVRRWLVALTFGYLLLVSLAWAFQGHLIHFPSQSLVSSPEDAGLRYQDVTIVTEDDERLHAWFVPAVESRGVLLFFHGNAGNISHRLESLRIFHRLQLDVLILDYRGYGRSTGSPSEQGLYRDGQAAWRYLTELRGMDPAEIVLFGRSLGAAVGANLAARQPAAGLIVESGFTSVADLGADLYPFLPVRLLARYRYPIAEDLAQVTGPVLVIHSREDEIIPFEHGQALYAAASEPKELLEIQGTHNTGFLTSGDQYIQGLEAFLNQVLEGASEGRSAD